MTRPVRLVREVRSRLGYLLPLVLIAAGCDASVTGHTATQSSFGIDPAMTSVLAGGQARFTGIVSGAPVDGVRWSASAGSITSEGVYTAPARTGVYQVQASHAGQTAVATVNVVKPGAPGAFYAAASSTCANNMPLRSTGTIHYFCDCQDGAQTGCRPGDDDAPGTTPETAKRRWYTATQTFNAMNAGDTIALCKGGAWNLDTATGTCGSSDPGALHDMSNAHLANPRCAAGSSLTDPGNTSTCDVRDYQASWGGTNRPLLAIPSSNTGTSIIIGLYGANTNGVRVMNLELRGNNNGPGGGTYNGNTGIYQGSCASTTSSDWLVCNNVFDRFSIGVHLEENGAFANRWSIWGNRFTMSWLDAILGGPGVDSRIDANFFDDNGGGRSSFGPTHTIYPNSPHRVTTGAQIVNNEIRYSSRPCGSAIISGHGAWSGLNVENNLIDCGTAPSGCWATKLDSGNRSGSGPHYQRNAHIHRNVIYAGSAGLGIGQAPGTIIENNVVVMTNGPTSWWRGILVPSEGNFGWDVTSDVQVRNNTIYIPHGDANAVGIQLGADRSDETETGLVVANNAVHTGGSSTSCFETRQAAGAYRFVGNNACYQGTWGTTYDGTAHVIADPLFTNPPADFTPVSAGSPLIGAGTAAYAPSLDQALQTRPSPPSIGAYEP